MLDKQSLSPLKQWSLTELDLQEAQISDPQMEAIQDIPTLRALNLNVNPISDEGVRRLLKLTELEKLGLYQTQVTDEACVLLSQLPKLKDVALHDTKITDAGLDSLAKLKNLQQLNLRDCKNITAEGVRKLQAALPNCKIESDFKDPDREVAEWVLSLPGERSVDVLVGGNQRQVAQINDLPAEPFFITHVRLHEKASEMFGDEDIPRFESLTQLKSMSVLPSKISPAGLTRLSESRLSKSLFVIPACVDSRFTDAMIPVLSRFTELQSFPIIRWQITNEGLHSLKLPKLASLTIEEVNIKLDTESLRAIVRGCPMLHELIISRGSLSGSDLECLDELKHLRDLRLVADNLNDADLVRIGKSAFESLEVLWLGYNAGIDDDGIEHLTGLKKLQSLNVAGTSITDAGLVHLVGLSQLQELALQDTSITDGGLATLANLQNLKALHLSGCKNITAEGVRKLQAALPKCWIGCDFKDPDREVAEWFFSLPADPKRLTIAVGDQQLAIQRVEELPASSFKILVLAASELATDRFTDRELMRLGSLEKLRQFDFNGLGHSRESPIRVSKHSATRQPHDNSNILPFTARPTLRMPRSRISIGYRHSLD